jgi:putative acetyltransferase
MFEKIIEQGPYIIRPYNAGDAPFIPSVVFKVLHEYGLVPEPDGVDKDLFAIEAHYKNGFFGVVEFEGEIIGTFGLSLMANKSCEIRKMYLAAEHRGKGLGKRMLNILLALAKEKKCSEVALETASVLKEAIQLYQSTGFKIVAKPNETIRCDKVYKLDLTK